MLTPAISSSTYAHPCSNQPSPMKKLHAVFFPLSMSPTAPESISGVACLSPSPPPEQAVTGGNMPWDPNIDPMLQSPSLCEQAIEALTETSYLVSDTPAHGVSVSASIACSHKLGDC